MSLICFMLSSLGNQTGFLGLWGKKVDAIDHYIAEIEKLNEQVSVFVFSFLAKIVSQLGIIKSALSFWFLR